MPVHMRLSGLAIAVAAAIAPLAVLAAPPPAGQAAVNPPSAGPVAQPAVQPADQAAPGQPAAAQSAAGQPAGAKPAKAKQQAPIDVAALTTKAEAGDVDSQIRLGTAYAIG